MGDSVDMIISQWTKERPELTDELWPVQVLGRIQRLGRYMDREMKQFAAERGLEFGELDVLTTLQRSGPPYQLTAGALLKSTMVTSGAITNRVDRMVTKGLVERVRDEGDRRTVKIRLTEQGSELTLTFMADHLANEARLLAGLDRAEADALGDGLRKLLVSLGDTARG